MGTPNINFAGVFGTRNVVSGLLYGVVYVILHLAVLVQYRRVTDGWTDRQTNAPYTVLAQYCAVKNILYPVR